MSCKARSGVKRRERYKTNFWKTESLIFHFLIFWLNETAEEMKKVAVGHVVRT